MVLRGEDTARKGLAGVNVRKKLAMLWVAKHAIKGVFYGIGHIMGLHDVHLADMDEVAEAAAPFYNNHLRGGEGHMEVGKLILNIAKAKATMTLSVKPFGCMPSSGVSDGVQSIDHREVPAGDLLPDRDQRRRRGQRLLARADDAVQGAAGGARRSTRPCSRRTA